MRGVAGMAVNLETIQSVESELRGRFDNVLNPAARQVVLSDFELNFWSGTLVLDCIPCKVQHESWIV